MSPDSAPVPIAAPPTSTRIATALELLAKLAIFGGPVFYLLGRIFAESYWSALGVPPSLMASRAEDYIYFGFFVITSGVLSTLAPLGSWSILISFLAPFAAIMFLTALFWGFGKL